MKNKFHNYKTMDFEMICREAMKIVCEECSEIVARRLDLSEEEKESILSYLCTFQKYSSVNDYFRSIDRYLKLLRNENIYNEYLKGYSTSYLAQKHDLSERRIQQIVKEKRDSLS